MKSLSTVANSRVEYTNGRVIFLLRNGKASNYRFSIKGINGMCTLELEAGKTFAVEIYGCEKEMK